MLAAIGGMISPSKAQKEEGNNQNFEESSKEEKKSGQINIGLESSSYQISNYHENVLAKQHLKELLQNEQRNDKMTTKFEDILFDFSHEKIDELMLEQFQKLCEEKKLFEKIEEMFQGEIINKPEQRAVLHVALRSDLNDEYLFQGQDVTKQVHKVLDQIQMFTQNIRKGVFCGYSGKQLTNYVVVGIGGSYLGIEFVYEALKNSPLVKEQSQGRKLRFLANVDPVDFARAVDGLDPESTLFIINSKTFTTAETMLNAKCCRQWLLDYYAKQNKSFTMQGIVSAHMCASSTALKLTSEFGINQDKVFGFWDWVGGRYSVCSTVGILPLSLIFSYEIMQQFLKGARSIDQHYRQTKNIKDNIPVMLGILGYYHSVIENYNARAILPYSQALCKFAPHIQQLDMESNGKGVLNTMPGERVGIETGVINFGEPGTRRVIPCEFIGFCKSQNPVFVEGEPVENHDELMSNFFSQPDALACGKTIQQLSIEGVPEDLHQHKFFPGNRPSLSILFMELNPYTCGQLLAIYEHRTAVEGFLYGINSFDQWGVELGKALAKNVREVFKNFKDTKQIDFTSTSFNSATQKQIQSYLEAKK